MQADERFTLAQVRLEHAEECLLSAKTLYADDRIKSAANRAYYCVFHAMRAVLALDGFDAKKHSGIISEFRKRYLKTQIFDTAFSKTISKLFDLRTDADYDDFYIVSKNDVINGIQDAEKFLSDVRQFLATKDPNYTAKEQETKS